MNGGLITIEDIVEKIFNKIDYYLDNAFNFLDKLLEAFFLFVKYVLVTFDKLSHGIMESLLVFYDAVAYYLRHIAYPWISIFPLYYRWKIRRLTKKIPLLRPGIQFVRSKVGGGKSLTSFVLAEMVLEETGHPSYMTSAVEKPQLSEDGKYWYVKHPVIDLNKYYDKGKKLLRFNTKKYKNMHKDENHLRFNPRMNKTKEYNDKFIPEHADEIVMRHDGFDTITKYSQHIRLDGQDLEMIDLMHEVTTVKDVPIKQYIKEGKYLYVPIRLDFESYRLEVNFDGSLTRKLFKKWSLKVPYELLERYDTYAERYKNNGLPFDFK